MQLVRIKEEAMALGLVYVLFAITCVIKISTASPTAVDVARNKPIQAEITCGSFGAPETYFGHSEIFQSPSNRQLRTCYNTSSHPASAMVDGRTDTWWQSTDRGQIINAGFGLNGKHEAVITLDLDQYFEIDRIIISMGDSKRPGRLVLYKSVDGIRFVPWIYRVTTEQDCTNVYQIPVLVTPRALDSRICHSYSTDFPASRNEKIEFDLSAVDRSLSAWRNLRYLRIEFYKMDLTLGINGVKFQHYTVTEIQVFAECVCNGHAVACQINSDSGQFQCLCGGNTTGLFCEQCDPFHNQLEFLYGRPCEPCNCFSHADACFYDPVTANFSRSLDSEGVYRGGGVCIDCRDNTAGVNCERCQPYHYRPLGVDQRSMNACLSCDCHGPGVVVNPLTGLTGDCIMNDDTLLPLAMVPGDCICKPNVTGSKCDRCKVGFYNLDANNPNGCTDCECDTRGTVAATPVCNTTTGQCPCKIHVTGEHCDSCRDQFYGMTMEDVEGCKACTCDAGASKSNVCDKETGQCPCRRGIDGRQCTQPQPGYYYPDPHFLRGEFESIRGTWDRSFPGFLGFGYAILSETAPAVTYITVPTGTNFSGNYYLLLRYEVSFNTTGMAYVFATGVTTITTEIHFPGCSGRWCYHRVGQGTDENIVLVSGKTYTIRISAGNRLKLDQAVALPVEFMDGTVPLGEEAGHFQSTCDVFSNDMKLGTVDESFCLSRLFSLTTYYLGGALPCDCHFLGTVGNTTCDTYGGQCACQTGVGGRQCDDCLLEYYNLQEGGCQACGCGSDYKVCDSITGHCVCPPNIVGRKCDQCMLNHWNWTAQHGCEPCECNPIGSASLQCNATTGVCVCKTGVQEPKCHECQDGFKRFSWTGCVPCDCNVAGSLSEVCNKASGQCPCKENVMGTFCSSCRGGTYYLNEHHHAGCLECICMGITKQCTSSTWRISNRAIPVVSANNTVLFDIVTEKETIIMELRTTDLDSFTMAEATVGSQPRQYWSPLDGLRGSLLGLFENDISFTVRYTADDPTGLPLENNRLIIVSAYRDLRFYLNVPRVPLGETTRINVSVTNENIIPTSANVSKGQFLLGLQNVQMVLIPASYYDRMHTSMIGNIHYNMASPDGEGEQALSMESCSCPAGYEGQSCEYCAPGYMRRGRDSHPYLGICRPCECHNHATDCDPDTGDCINCQHNTAGPTCNLCKEGFYGSADIGTPYDCLPCPCYEPRVANGTCLVYRGRISCLFCAEGYIGSLCDKCDTFYHGNPEIPRFGTCNPCFCNGNTDKCNSQTGECLDCQYDTMGVHCEHCADGFFGNASRQSCDACECDMGGSRSSVCDHVTGQCDCFIGVGGRTCDSCLPDYYGYTNASFEGCLPCECNTFGSTSTQCDETGTCTCGPNSAGYKCTTCTDGFWGLPTHECQACDCDPVGSVDSTAPCEPKEGQCLCKPGVGGRRCDKCQFLHVDFGPDGCTACSECQFSLGNDTAMLNAQFQAYAVQVHMIAEVQHLDAELQTLSVNLNSSASDLGISEGRLDTLTGGVAVLLADAPGHNQTVHDLLSRAHTLETSAVKLNNDSVRELSRQEGILNVAQLAYQGAAELNTTSPEILSRIISYTSTAEQLHIDSGKSSSRMDVDFDKERATITSVAANLSDVASKAFTILEQAKSTGNITSHLHMLTVMAEQQFHDLELQFQEIKRVMAEVQVKADDVAESFNITKYYKLHAETLFNEAQTLIAMTEVILADSRASYDLSRRLLANTEGILKGVESGPLPIDTSLVQEDTLAGIWSWTQSSGKLDLEINATVELVRSRYPLVEDMENKSRSLVSHVQALSQEFERVRPHGERAVEAIQKYEAVTKTLEQSVAMAVEANQTVAMVMETLRGVSIATMEMLASESLTESQRLLSEIRRQQISSDELHAQLRLANATLTDAAVRWENRYGLSSVFLAAATAIHELAKDTNSGLEEDKPLVAEPIEEAYIAADAAIATADVVLAQNARFDEQINIQTDKARLIREENNNATELASHLSDQLDTFQRVLESDIQTNIELTEALRPDTAILRENVKAQLTSVEEKIERALQSLLALKQAVGLSADQHEVMDNPVANTLPMLHNQLIIEFQVTSKVVGLLLFTENNRTRELLMLHFIDEQLVFAYNNGDELLEVRSRANICPGCWFRVIATRYGIDGHLTVIRLSDGATTSEHIRGYNQDDRLALNTPLYIGGLPPNYFTTKVSTTQGEFEGCVDGASLDGVQLDLWAKILTDRSTANCCIRPPKPPRPALTEGFSLGGFGGRRMPVSNRLAIAQQAHVQFDFRPVDDSGVLMVVDRERTSDYFGLFLNAGRVILSLGGAGWQQSVRSRGTYSNGQWYRLSASYNRTLTMLVVEFVDKSINSEVDVSSEVALGRELAALEREGSTIVFGAHNPLTTSHGQVTDYFAGCVRNVRFMPSGGTTLEEVDVPALAETLGGASPDICYDQVIPGLGFSEPTSYTRLANERMAISVLEFSFQTYEPSGMLIYGQRPEGTAPYFYIAVFNGDLFVMFNQGVGIQPVLRTRGLYLSDGREHAVHIDFSYQNNPRLNVNGEMHHGAVRMTPNMAIAGGPIYLGGVPASMPLPSQFPARQSLIGGFRDLQINGQLVDFYSPQQLDSRLAVAAYLSGLPLPPSERPPLPYTTTPAPPTTPPPTCAEPYELSFTSQGVRFGHMWESYISFDTSPYVDLFKNSFTITVEFRALQPNGLLVYAADTSDANPVNYFALFLEEGRIVFNMDTNSVNANATPPRTKRIMSRYKYDSGQWTEATVLRINDFVALVVTSSRDYMNNGVLSTERSSLNINTLLYIGGAPRSFGGIPFTGPHEIPNGNIPFYGCVRRVEVATHNPEPVVFDLSRPVENVGTLPCFSSVKPGIFINATDASIRLRKSNREGAYNILPNFRFNITFHGTALDGTLLIAYQSFTRFFLVELVDGEVRGLMADDSDRSLPFVFGSSEIIGRRLLCDNRPHTVEVALFIDRAELRIDNYGPEFFTYPLGFLFAPMYSTPIFVGGHRDPTWVFPVQTSGRSYHGCVTSFYLNDDHYVLAEMDEVHGAFAGCPAGSELPDGGIP